MKFIVASCLFVLVTYTAFSQKFEVEAGYFSERRFYHAEHEISGTSAQVNFEEYLFLKFKYILPKFELWLEQPAALGTEPQMFQAGINRVLRNQALRLGLVFRQTSFYRQNYELFPLINRKHNVSGIYYQNIGGGFGIRRGHTVGPSITFMKKGKVIFDQSISILFGNLRNIDLVWWWIDPESNLVLQDDYRFDAGLFTQLSAKTGILMPIIKEGNFSIGLGYSFDFRLDRFQEEVSVSEFINTRENVTQYSYFNSVLIPSFRHYFRIVYQKF